MLRLAVICPGDKIPLYEAALARTEAVQVTHVVGENRLGQAAKLHDEDALAKNAGQFDAIVIHSAASENQLANLAQAGKHTLIDSPWDDSAALERLAKNYQRSAARLTIAQPRRFTPYAIEIRKTLDAGHVGQPGLVRIHHWGQATTYTDASQQHLQHLFAQELDVACWLFGTPPHSVFGQAITVNGVVRGWQGHLGFSTGMALVDCVLHAADSYYTVSLIGSTGAVYADDHHNTNLMYQGHTQGLRVTSEADWLRLQLESFAGSIESGADDQTVYDTQMVFAIRDAAIESAAANRVSQRVGDQYELQ